MENDVILQPKIVGKLHCGGYTAADLEKAREDERGRCWDEVKCELIDNPVDGLESVQNYAVKNCMIAIKSLGPVSSIEERVRRETVKKVNDILDDFHGAMPTSYMKEKLIKIAEGGEG